MIREIIRQLDFNLTYARQLVADLDAELMTYSPGPGFENHPAFTLGHLVTGTTGMIEDLGGKAELPAGWAELFLRKGPGDPRYPEKRKELYPSKAELLAELTRQHEVLKSLLTKCEKETLQKPIRWRFSSALPSTLDLVLFMCINHEAMHLGQLAAWRRAMNFPSALAKIS